MALLAKPTVRQDSSNGVDRFGAFHLDEGNLSRQTAQHIRELLHAGDLQVGDRLPSERELGERFNVSRTVIREAIQILRAEGLVRIRMGVGTFVTQSAPNILEGPLSALPHPESKKIQDLHQVRNVIEPAIAALAAENATPAHIARMEQAIADMDLYLADRLRYIESDNLFHIALAEASNNSVYLLVLNSIVQLLQESRELADSGSDSFERTNTYHKRILEAVRAGEPRKAHAAMLGHLRQSTRVAHTTMSQDPITPRHIRS